MRDVYEAMLPRQSEPQLVVLRGAQRTVEAAYARKRSARDQRGAAVDRPGEDERRQHRHPRIFGKARAAEKRTVGIDQVQVAIDDDLLVVEAAQEIDLTPQLVRVVDVVV